MAGPSDDLPIPQRLQAITSQWDQLRAGFDDAALAAHVAELEEAMGAPGFWDDQQSAAQVSADHSRATRRLERWRGLASDVEDLRALAEMAEEDESVAAEVAGQMSVVEARLVELLEASPGEEAGIKSATFRASGENAYGLFSAEKGVHRLVRLSPFDAAHRRQTSFAGLEVAPAVEDVGDIEIEDDDLQIDTYRASGAGGQHVNKTDSAVRVTHRPSGIVVQCQNERSQSANKDTAMKMLRAKLLEREEAKRREEIAAERGEAQDVNFGSQIRSYVLHPYTMVKDHRTSFEVGDAQRVLDGDLDGFVRAELMRTAGHA
jgi:peptide chain release factor 2